MFVDFVDVAIDIRLWYFWIEKSDHVCRTTKVSFECKTCPLSSCVPKTRHGIRKD
jgi:hypothetical protein